MFSRKRTWRLGRVKSVFFPKGSYPAARFGGLRIPLVDDWVEDPEEKEEMDPDVSIVAGDVKLAKDLRDVLLMLGLLSEEEVNSPHAPWIVSSDPPVK